MLPPSLRPERLVLAPNRLAGPLRPSLFASVWAAWVSRCRLFLWKVWGREPGGQQTVVMGSDTPVISPLLFTSLPPFDTLPVKIPLEAASYAPLLSSFSLFVLTPITNSLAFVHFISSAHFCAPLFFSLPLPFFFVFVTVFFFFWSD